MLQVIYLFYRSYSLTRLNPSQSMTRQVEKDPLIPIIIINWNGYEDTIECLGSVLKLNYPAFHIHLLDNGSDLDEGDRLSRTYENNTRVTVYKLDANIGFAGGNALIVNQLLKTDVTYIALLNNDTVVDENWLTVLVQTAKKFDAHVLSSKIIYYHDHTILDNVGHRMLNTGEIIPIGHGESVSRYNSVFENLGSCAAATLYSAEMIRKIGFFDDFFDTGYEDAEFGVRAFLTGYKCIFVPDAIVYHKVGRAIKKIFNYQYALRTYNNIQYSYYKLMPAGVILISLPFIVIKLILMIISNLLFWRPLHLRILFLSLFQTIFTNRPVISSKREAFFKSNQTIPVWQILSGQTFFFLFDIKRFIRFNILRRKSAIDTYGI